MVAPDVLARLMQSETDRIEWLQSTNDREGILRAVGALANDLADSRVPGHVVVGLDRVGKVRGIDPDGGLDDQQKVLADRLLSSKIQPVPSTTVSIASVEGRHLLVVQVEPYAVPPVVEVDGQAWVRVGSTTRRASHADMQRLTERRPLGRLPFDTRPFAGATLADVDLRTMRSAYEAARDADADKDSFPTLEAWLAQKQYGKIEQGQFVPNAATILLSGHSPQDHVPGALVDLVRYRGRDHDSDVVSRRTATGTVVDQLEVGWAWLAAQVDSVPAPASGIRESFVPTYPEAVLKELLRNLVQHRLYDGSHAPARVEWFEDRIEFSNPGGPFGRASEGEFGSHSDYRNPLLTARLVTAGHVQQLGRGVRLARSQLQQNGNPPLVVETDGFTRVIVRRRT